MLRDCGVAWVSTCIFGVHAGIKEDVMKSVLLLLLENIVKIPPTLTIPIIYN